MASAATFSVLGSQILWHVTMRNNEALKATGVFDGLVGLTSVT